VVVTNSKTEKLDKSTLTILFLNMANDTTLTLGCDAETFSIFYVNATLISNKSLT